MRKYLALLLASLLCHAAVPAKSSSQEHICPNACSGHGTCKLYTCYCTPPYSGDDCSHVAASDALEPLTVGDFNVTSLKQFKALTTTNTKKKKSSSSKSCNSALIGFSAPTASCYSCSASESVYMDVHARVNATDNVLFLRVNAHKHPTLLSSSSQQQILPYLQFYDCNSKTHTLYTGRVASDDIVGYVEKRLGKAVKTLKASDNEHFDAVDEITSKKHQISVIGFFSDLDMQEDEYEDFREYCETVAHLTANVHCAAVTKPLPASATAELFPRTPAVVVFRPSTDKSLPPLLLQADAPALQQSTVDHDHFLLDTDTDLAAFVNVASLPSVSYLTPESFGILTATKKHMIILFLDISAAATGGILNYVLYKELLAVSKDPSLAAHFTFCLANGNDHVDRMTLLGLRNGFADLPALAVNGNDGRTSVFPSNAGINSDTLLAFLTSFLNGKRDGSNAMVAKAAAANRRNTATRPAVGRESESEAGVSEKLNAKTDKEFHTLNLTPENYSNVINRADRDIVVMIYKGKGCSNCDAFSVYYKHVSKRFAEHENTKNVVVAARLDLSSDEWGSDESSKLVSDLGVALELGKLPVLLLFPRFQKALPYYYTDIGKPLQIMKWIGSICEIEMGELPHLNAEEVALYKEQIVAREKRRVERASGEEL
jgi:hypothetical protein